MIRLIGIFLTFALFLVFIMLNLDNKSNVHLGFYVFNDAPVYITVFFSIFIGMLISLPLFAMLTKRKNKPQPEKKPEKKNKTIPDLPEEIIGENGPYGIN